MIVTSVWQALRKGKELKQAGALKDIQNVTLIMTAILSATISVLRVLGVDLHMTDKDIVVAAGGIASLLFVGSSVVTSISSSKAGIPLTDEEKRLERMEKIFNPNRIEGD